LISLTRREKEKLVVELYENGRSYREIAKEARVSLRDIKGILDRASGVHTMSKSSQAYQMFSEGKSPTKVAIALYNNSLVQCHKPNKSISKLL
jgi:transposase